MPNCAYCRIHACDRKAAQQMPPNCPSHDITDQTLMEYLTERNRDFGREASIVSMSPDGKLPRIMEIIDLAHRCRFQKLGVAFCMGFVKEAEILASILKRHNFPWNLSSARSVGLIRRIKALKTVEKPCATPSLKRSCSTTATRILTLRSVCASAMIRCFSGILKLRQRYSLSRIRFLRITHSAHSTLRTAITGICCTQTVHKPRKRKKQSPGSDRETALLC